LICILGAAFGRPFEVPTLQEIRNFFCDRSCCDSSYSDRHLGWNVSFYPRTERYSKGTE